MKHLLLLCNRPADGTNANTIIDHINSLLNMPGWEVFELSIVGNIPQTIDLNYFDAIGIHYTLILSDPNYKYISQSLINTLSNFKGLKCIWLHDEYRQTQRVANILKTIGIHVIFSLATSPTIEKIYPKTILPNVLLKSVFAGYVPKLPISYKLQKIADRIIDVSYRARRPPYWLGYLGQEKINIAQNFKNHPLTKNLKLNISIEEYDRIYGNKWLQLLSQSKTVLCVESGSSIIDFTGKLEKEVEKFCKDNPNSTFVEVKNKYFANIDGKYLINTISPRIFEAAMMNTVLIAFEGKYANLLRPWVHYIPLKKDFSNISKVIKAINDIDLLEELSQKTRKDLIESKLYSYQVFSKLCSNTLLYELQSRKTKTKDNYYTHDTFVKCISNSHSYILRNYSARILQLVFFNQLLRGYVLRIWNKTPKFLRVLLKPIVKLSKI